MVINDQVQEGFSPSHNSVFLSKSFEENPMGSFSVQSPFKFGSFVTCITRNWWSVVINNKMTEECMQPQSSYGVIQSTKSQGNEASRVSNFEVSVP